VQKGIGIFTKSVKFADFPSAETAKLRFGLPPSTALTRGTGTSPARKPLPARAVRAALPLKRRPKTARGTKMKKIRKIGN
jgi:hypothetical protein